MTHNDPKIKVLRFVPNLIKTADFKSEVCFLEIQK